MLSLLAFVLATQIYAASWDVHEPGTWLGADARDFGCFLEKKLGSLDSEFRCASPAAKSPAKDPQDTSGPVFVGDPKQVNPFYQSISFSWEGGKLREISIRARDEKKTLPAPKVPRSVAVAVIACDVGVTCFTLQAFDPYQRPLQAERPAAWSRSRANAFGCFLERKTGYRDPKFNCALKNYVNSGDPCRNTEAYYEGPKLPREYARKLHPDFSEVELTWEHGLLQSFQITIAKKMTLAQARKLFALPEQPVTVGAIGIEVGKCKRDETCLSVTAFDHQGAGDVDCGNGGR